MSLELDSAPICLELLTPSEADVQHVTLTEAIAAAASAAGGSGQLQLQLWSLLAGLIKHFFCDASSQQLAQGFPAACRHTVAYATQLLVLQPMQRSQPDEGPAATSSASGSGTYGSTAAQAAGISTAAVLSVQDMAPWLVLCGRCLLLWAAELITALDLDPELLAQVGGSPISKQQEMLSTWVSARLGSAAEGNGSEGLGGEGFRLRDVGLDFDKSSDAAADLQLLCTTAVVLQAARDAGQLTKPGYNISKALTALQMAAVLAKQPVLLVKRTESSEGSDTDSSDDHSSSDDDSSDGLGYTVTRYGQGLLVLKLQEAGRLLSALPFGWGCNNLACNNFSKGSELQQGFRAADCQRQSPHVLWVWDSAVLQQGVSDSTLEAA